MNQLPTSLQAKIFGLMEFRSRFQVAPTCNHWKEMIYNTPISVPPTSWKERFWEIYCLQYSQLEISAMNIIGPLIKTISFSASEMEEDSREMQLRKAGSLTNLTRFAFCSLYYAHQYESISLVAIREVLCKNQISLRIICFDEWHGRENGLSMHEIFYELRFQKVTKLSMMLLQEDQLWATNEMLQIFPALEEINFSLECFQDLEDDHFHEEWRDTNMFVSWNDWQNTYKELWTEDEDDKYDSGKFEKAMTDVLDWFQATNKEILIKFC